MTGIASTRSASQPGTWTSLVARPAVLMCASLSLAAHAYLLAGAFAMQVHPGHASAPVTRATSALHVRMLQAAQADASDAVPTPPPTHDHQAQPDEALDEPPDTPEVTPQAQVAPTVAPDIAATPPPTTTLSTEAAADTEREEYVPRPQLSVAPVPQTPVLITPPAGETDVSRKVAVLSLFIDANGRVHHIVANEPRLPMAFEQAARAAFMGITFSPGQLDGQAVKSKIRVEVVFDNTPFTSP